MSFPSSAASSDVDVYYIWRSRGGWYPIQNLARLTAELFGSKLIITDAPPRSRVRELGWRLRGKSSDGDRCAVLIATGTPELSNFLEFPGFRDRYSFIVAWIVDSFATEDLPPQRVLDHYDLLIQMSPIDQDYYASLVGGRSRYLPFGSDVLRLGGFEGDRDIDLLRVGRQPPTWNDDAASKHDCETAGVSFHGRPPKQKNAAEDMEGLARFYRRSKFTIAHSNLVAPTKGTHPTKEYISARWMDSVSNGTVVAGIHPRTDPSIEHILWPDALLDLDGIERASNIEQLKPHIGAWTAERARYNYRMALERLDWRWRLRDLASWIGISVPKVDDELAEIEGKIGVLDKNSSAA